jgi:hypothetical protein
LLFMNVKAEQKEAHAHCKLCKNEVSGRWACV